MRCRFNHPEDVRIGRQTTPQGIAEEDLPTGDGKKVVNPTLKKNDVMQLALDGMQWQEQLLKYKESLVDEKSKSEEATEFYEGELLRKHGRKEFGKLVGTALMPAKDKFGNDCYVKTTRSALKKQTHLKELSVEQSTDINDDEFIGLEMLADRPLRSPGPLALS